MPQVLNLLEAHATERVLDIGSPKMAPLFLKWYSGAVVYSTDLFDYFIPELEMLSKLLKFDKAAFNYECQDARKLTYNDNTFDKVFSISVLEHIEAYGDQEAMREIARVLKPRGKFVFSVPFNKKYKESLTSNPIYYKETSGGKPVFFERHYDWNALQKRLFNGSGLQPVHIEFWGEPGFRYEAFLNGLPRLLKIVLSCLSPLPSRFFLKKMSAGDDNVMTAIIVMEKK